MQDFRFRYLLISFLGHLLMCISIVTALYEPRSIPFSTTYLPAYVYETPSPKTLPVCSSSTVPVSKHGIDKNRQQQNVQSTLSQRQPSRNQPQTSQQSRLYREKTYYTTEKNIDKPLLKLLHDSTAAHLIYPAIAIDLGQKGVVQIGFLLAPTGVVSHIVLLKSSGFDVLDNAALSAVKEMSPVKNVSVYLQTPKLLAVDVVFQ